MDWNLVSTRLRALRRPKAWPGVAGSVYTIAKWGWRRIGDIKNVQFIREQIPTWPKHWNLPLLHVIPTSAVFVAGIAWSTVILLRPTKRRAIIGKADLLITRLDLRDLSISWDSRFYQINLGVFIKMSIAVVDKRRPFTGFDLTVEIAEAKYHARSEQELGDYQHVYRCTYPTGLGHAAVETVKEPMVDLAARLRQPLDPETHKKEGWARFELKQVRQGHDQPCKFRVTLFAIDAIANWHPVDASNIRVMAIDSHEFAELRQA
ncbi:MAG: hypothetical protein DMG73_14045 [Acidobacteria bacterium]|nr:MAG: hypothetical protein DMG73_14045 [Acidobacteriota bacterium]